VATGTRVPANDAAANEPDLGVMRTLMAADRTLMAWIRISLASLSFGYSIYKILQDFQEAGTALPRDNTPRNVGVVLALAGTVSLLMGTVEYWGTLRLLRRHYAVSFARPALITALVMSAVGVLLIVGILSRLV
jgi:putative membrane protein